MERNRLPQFSGSIWT